MLSEVADARRGLGEAVKVSKDPDRKAMLSLAEQHMRDVFVCRLQISLEARDAAGDRTPYVQALEAVLEKAVPPTNPPLPPGDPPCPRPPGPAPPPLPPRLRPPGPPPDEYQNERSLCLHAYAQLSREYWPDTRFRSHTAEERERQGRRTRAPRDPSRKERPSRLLKEGTGHMAVPSAAPTEPSAAPAVPPAAPTEAPEAGTHDEHEWYVPLWPCMCACTGVALDAGWDDWDPWYAYGYLCPCGMGLPPTRLVPVSVAVVSPGSALQAPPVPTDLPHTFRPPPGLELPRASSIPEPSCTAGSSGDIFRPAPPSAGPSPTQPVAPTTHGKGKQVQGGKKGGKRA